MSGRTSGQRRQGSSGQGWPGPGADPARQAALECLTAVDEQDAYANLIMPRLLAQWSLNGRDAAFATELAYGTLRMRGLYDPIIEHASRRSITALDPPVLRVLRMGVHQVWGMRVPAHAAVSQTVSLARASGVTSAAGFVNAVMRRVTEKDHDGWLATIAPGSTRRDMSVRHSHPAWVVEALETSLVADGRAGQVEAVLAADNTPAKVTLAARPGLVEQSALVAAVPGAAPGRWAPTAVVLDAGQPSRLAQVRSGVAGVQDEGSQLAALSLVGARPVEPGERWLDMCAGPGGKTALLGAMAAQHGVTVDAIELHEHRADLVRQAVRAIPAGTVTVTAADARVWTQSDGYDRILLDAPCSGLGALRRRPEARWRREPSDLPELVALQQELLTAAARLLKPGGVVAYVTCSPVLAETREVIDAVTTGTPLRPVHIPEVLADLTGAPPEVWGVGPHVQLWPDRHGTDAMFISILASAG